MTIIMGAPEPHAASWGDDASARTSRVCSTLARGSAVVTIAISVVALVGWEIDSATLAGIAPALPRLKPNTAVALVLLSVSLLALERRGAHPIAHRVGRIAAMLAMVLGLATLVAVAFDFDLGIDRWLVPSGACVDGARCARPSLNAAIDVVMLAAALLVLDVPTQRMPRPAQILAMFVGFTSLAAIAGYVYGAPPMYRVPGFGPATGLSVHASIGFTVLAIGVLCARPRVGVMRIVVSNRPGGAVARRFLAAALVAPLLGLLFTFGEKAGVYSPQMSAALLSVTAMVVFIAWVLRTAAILDESDRALRATERRHRTFVERASDAIFLADVTGQLVYVNAAACELLAYPREELLGMAISDLVAPEEIAVLAESRERLLTGGVDRREWSLRSRRGELVPVEATATIAPNGQWQVSVRDIRERKRIEKIEDENMHRVAITSEASLVFSEALAAVPESGFEGVLRAIADEARVATSADAAILDVAADATSGARPMSISVGGTRAIAHRLSTGVHIGDRQIGMLRVVKDVGHPGFDEEDGTTLNALAPRAALAIESARSYARETEGRARLQALLDNMPAGVVFVGAGGSAPVHNRFLDELVGACDLEREDHPLQRALRTRERVVERRTFERRDGTRVAVLVTAAPVLAPNGDAGGAVATFHDISAIEELERLREDWSTIVAHELRQPLNAIALAVQLLEHPSPDESPSGVVRRIRTAVMRLDRMIEDLSDVSRIDAGRLRLSLRPVRVRGLVEDVIERSGERARIEEEGSARPTIMLDPVRIEQVVGNLVSNAAKYRKPDTPIEVAIDWRDEDVVVSVTNENGAAAIAPKDAARIFDRFTRADAAARSGVRGLGIGLYISRRLVEAHGGQIWVDTTTPERTSVRVSLPLDVPMRTRSGVHRIGEVTPAASLAGDRERSG